MIDCKQAARLTSESQDRPLTWGERFQLAYHLGLCEMCRCYSRQMKQISALLRLSRERDPAAPLPAGGLSPEAKARIVAAMETEGQS
jgi:predicted anti-sigma-YlaC factor YlaD